MDAGQNRFAVLGRVQSILNDVRAERAVDGQQSDLAHLSARGCELYTLAVLDTMATAALEEPLPCDADCGDGDGTVGVVDLLALLGNWGATPGACELTGDGMVGVPDLLTLLESWGACP